MFIKIGHSDIEARKTLNDFSVQVRNLLLPLSLKVPTKGRVIHILSMLAFSSDPHHHAKTNRLPSRQVSSQLTDFFKNSQNPPRASGKLCHSVSVAPVSYLGLL